MHEKFVRLIAAYFAHPYTDKHKGIECGVLHWSLSVHDLPASYHHLLLELWVCSVTPELHTVSMFLIMLNTKCHFHRKKLFSAVHNFVHLNLSIALLLGYLVFGVGVELAASNEVCLHM